MKRSESHHQPDLFSGTEEKPPLFYYTYPDYMLKMRRPEMQAMLKKVQEATEFPFRNLTVAMTEEMKFNSTARMFPPEEGMAFLEAYAAAIPRVYELIGEPWWPLYYAVLQKQYSNDPAQWKYIQKDDSDLFIDEDIEADAETGQN